MRYMPYLISAGLTLAALNAHASPYLTLEAGQTRSNLDTAHFQSYHTGIINQGGSAILSEDNKDTAVILSVGYQYTPYLAIEASYLNLGEVSATSNTTDTSSTGITRTRTIKETAEQNGVLLSAIGQYSVNDHWRLKAQLGFAWLKQTASGSANGQSVNAAGTVLATESESFSKSNNERVAVVGLGVGYQLKPDWQLQLNWRRVMGTEPGVLGKQDLDLLTAGVRVSF
ncbi:Outer membrane protein beta-barrel domain-containing protein [Oceanospirillum multiglobuliferum]|uniref:Outer membrane protein beta-barrel domain-containing protein n=1 Tax=Oceanospirillum multiglobuliferum TaxID=64969 RepID=A0A1T4SCT5_9GAMM|nr:outer membrane beta-barrel protein [Oceanospirillum multiglobuliferum]OPX55029.1 hypothetical protein BTE48_11160 [Oceanospirillum multiglobuliferum]SKA25671.1 Outer membrane protein beta-barrel domain-containing protein [Oceanospirillum multiglobuliferum]